MLAVFMAIIQIVIIKRILKMFTKISFMLRWHFLYLLSM